MAVAFDRTSVCLDDRSYRVHMDEPEHDSRRAGAPAQSVLSQGAVSEAGKRYRMAFLVRHYLFIPQIVACVVAYVVWTALDRTPPLTLFDGEVVPNIVHIDERDVQVFWKAHYSGRDCPGLSQRELVDSGRHLWPELKRMRAGVFMASQENPRLGTVITPPLTIPNMLPGRAHYRVTQFYYCNWLQRLLNWPIIQTSPLVPFEVAPR